MRILIALFRYFPYGGLQRDFLAIAEECLRRGHQVTCFTEQFEGDVPEGLIVRTCTPCGLSNHARAKSFARLLKEHAAEGGYDRTLSFNRVGSGFDFYFAADDCLAAKWRNSFLGYLPRRRTFLTLERKIFEPASKTEILLITERQKREYKTYYGTEEERFHLLPPGIDPGFRPGDSRAEIRAEFKIPDHAVLLIQIAAKFKVKGVDRTLEIVSGLPAELRRNLYLLFVGESESGPYKRLAERLGLDAQCVFLPPRGDIARLCQGADLMIHPARAEAAGNVIAEALACGLPVLTTELCGFASLAREAGCPVIPEPYEAEVWRTELKEMLSNGKSDELRKQVRRYAERADLTRRAGCAADILEQTRKEQ